MLPFAFFDTLALSRGVREIRNFATPLLSRLHNLIRVRDECREVELSPRGLKPKILLYNWLGWLLKLKLRF